MGFPGIVLDENGNDVNGYLFCSERLEHHWHKLDAFEGDEYKRVLVQVFTKDNKRVEAFIYKLKEA